MIPSAWGLSDGSAAVTGESKQLLKVADEVWIATALLHRENPQSEDFSVEEIARRAEREALAGGLRASFHMHVAQHCVANRPPHPARHRMLFETSPGRRGCFARAIRITRPARVARSLPTRSKCLTATESCSRGTAFGAPRRRPSRLCTITRCSRFNVQRGCPGRDSSQPDPLLDSEGIGNRAPGEAQLDEYQLP